MDQHSSSGEHRRPRQQGPRRSGSRSSSGSRRPSRDGDRDSRNRPPRDNGDFRPGDHVSSTPRRPRSSSRAPKLSLWQKIVKVITFGAVDFSKKPKKRATSGATARQRVGSKERGERREPVLVEPTSGRLYIGNLSYDVTDADLAELFGTVGTVVSASVVMQPGGGRSKGFAFVEMATVEDAKAAATKLHDQDLQGRRILVTGAKPERSGDRPERSERGERLERGERSERKEGREPRERRERGPRSGETEKPSRQVKAPVIEVVTTPRLQVGPFNQDASEADIHSIFEGIGSIQTQVEAPGATAEQRHFIIELAETSEAQKAVELLDGKSFMGVRLRLTGAIAE